MHDHQFTTLRDALLAGGIATRHAQRLIMELADHCEDLERDAIAAGYAPADARAEALRSLGDPHLLADAVLARPELLGWSARWPRTAHAMSMLATRHALPVHCRSGHCALIARWSASCGLAVMLTGSLLLSMHWIIIAA